MEAALERENQPPGQEEEDVAMGGPQIIDALMVLSILRGLPRADVLLAALAEALLHCAGAGSGSRGHQEAQGGR